MSSLDFKWLEALVSSRLSSLVSSLLQVQALALAHCQVPLWSCSSTASQRDGRIIRSSRIALLALALAPQPWPWSRRRRRRAIRSNTRGRTQLSVWTGKIAVNLSAGHAAGDSTGASSQQSLSTGVQTFQNGQGQTPGLSTTSSGGKWPSSSWLLNSVLYV
ncbi:hypothetical protein GGI42DRAFT_318886 [Trichoderma sp. SZMC 28013]